VILAERLRQGNKLEGEKRRVLRTRKILRTAVSKLINAYISGTLLAVFRKGASVLKNSFVPFSDSRSGA
jgi:hypothetical protein